MLKGEVRGIIRNARTLEVEGEFIQSNIVVNNTYSFLQTGSNTLTSSNVCASPSPLAPTLYIPASDTAGITTYSGVVVPGHSVPDYFPASGMISAYAQWSARILPQSTDTSILTVMLATYGGTPGVTANTTFTNNIRAFTQLSSACPQLHTQVVDVYYRIYFPLPSTLELPHATYNEIFKTMVGVAHGSGSAPNSMVTGNTFQTPDMTTTPDTMVLGIYQLYMAVPLGSIVTSGLYKLSQKTNLQLADGVGVIISEFATYTSDTEVLINITRLPTVKIQNVIGHTATGPRPFFDLDNIATGTGSVIPSGTWPNVGTPANVGMYYTGLLPEKRFINITTGGEPGIAQYNYSKRPFIGHGFFYINTTGAIPLTEANNNTFTHPTVCLPILSSAHNSVAGGSLYGDLTQFSVRQVSSIVAYDNVSVVIPTASQLFLYNIANGALWTLTGGFTTIQQLAVVSGVIYIGCRNTGLWTVDPTVTTSCTNITSPGGGIDLSRCYGVSKGYSNSVWVVANNGLAQLVGSTWSFYNASVGSNTFVMVGVSDGNWNCIEYLKVDSANVNNNMLLVRRLDAATNSTLLGVWWSLATSATNTGADPSTASNQPGHPRTNRQHLGVSNTSGFWACLISNTYYRLTFDGTSFDSIYTNTFDYIAGPSPSAINFVQSQTNTDVLLVLYSINKGTSVWQYRFATYNPDLSLNTLGTAINTGDITQNGPSVGGIFIDMTTASSGLFSGYGSQDTLTNILMGNGVMFQLAASQTPNNNAGAVQGGILVYCFDGTSGGGPLAYLGQTNYGWNGSSWVSGSSTPKTTHTSAQVLDDTISIHFSAGSPTPSFVTGEYYTFACCEGLLKDNVTTNYIENSSYLKKHYPNTTLLSSSTVPTPVAGSTGVVMMDLARSSSDTYITFNGSNQFVFDNGNRLQQGVGSIQVTGDFLVQYTLSTANNNTQVNIGRVGDNSLICAFLIDGSGTISVGTYYINGSNIQWSWTSSFTMVIGGGTNSYNVSSTSSVAVARVGSTLHFYVNGTTSSNEFNTSSGVGLPVNPVGTGYQVFDLFCSPNSTIQNVNASVTSPVTTIINNGSTNAVKIGSASSGGTGAFNSLFYTIDTDATNGIVGTTNSVPWTAVHTNGTASAAGEVSVDGSMGTFSFNSSDQGLPITVNCTYMTNE